MDMIRRSTSRKWPPVAYMPTSRGNQGRVLVKATAFLLTSIVWCWVAVPSAGAVDPVNLTSEYSLTSWGPRDGLPSGPVWVVAQDAEGFLWLGTDGGPVRFDGTWSRPWSFLTSTP